MAEKSIGSNDKATRPEATSPTERRRVYQLLEARIQSLAARGISPAEIHKALEKLANNGTIAPSSVPNLRTVERYAARVSRITMPKWWSVAGTNLEEARLVLPVLGKLIQETGGIVKTITTLEAKWIAALLTMRPELTRHRAVDVFFLALDYAERELTSEPTTDLDYYLAFADQPFEYLKLVRTGILPEPRHGRFSILAPARFAQELSTFAASLSNEITEDELEALLEQKADQLSDKYLAPQQRVLEGALAALQRAADEARTEAQEQAGEKRGEPT